MSDTVWAAAVSSVLLLLGTLFTLRIKLSEKKVDQVSAGLASQLAGWDTYAKSLRGRIEEAEKENIRWNERVTVLQVKNNELENRCDVLEEEIIKLRRLISQLEYNATHGLPLPPTPPPLPPPLSE